MFGLCPPFAHVVVTSVIPHCVGLRTRSCAAWRWGSPPPQGSSLLSELCCLEPSSLNRPHPPHPRAHHDFTAWRLIRNAFAVRERRGDPRVVPGFRWPFFLGMPLSMTPGSSIIASPELRCRHRLRRDLSSSALPILPQSVSRGARLSGLPDSRICYGLPSCSLPCTDQTDCSALGSVYFQASNGSVALPVAGYDYNSDWTPLLAGLSPARMAASLAAPDPVHAAFP